MSDDTNPTPATKWLRIREAAPYAKRGPRTLRQAIKRGELRAAQVGGRGEYLTTQSWIDDWLESLARPVLVSRRMMR